MRVLRSSLFTTPSDFPMTSVMRDRDLNDTIESAREGMKQPQCLVVFDIFESEHEQPSIAQATAEAMGRMQAREQRERNMAVLYFYGVHILRMLVPGGLWQTPDPAPLTVEEVAAVFEQLAEHPQYDGQTLATRAEDGTSVKVASGKVEVGT